MNLRDLQRLERRIEKIKMKEQPPTLSMKVIGPNDPEPENIDQWIMCINIKPKPADWHK